MAETLPDSIYDETQVPDYTLPDPLISEDGEPIKDADMWMARRRPEILSLFETYVYGRAPAPPDAMSFDVRSTAAGVLEGLATRREVAIRFTEDLSGPELDLLIYLPDKRSGPVPLFLGLNFTGNHTIHPDPGITPSGAWAADHPELEVAETRGTSASRWPVEMILKRGYGLATIYRGDIDPDYDDGFRNGVHGLFARDDSEGDAWGTISAWAWGLSRALDYLQTDGEVDTAHVAVMGHSRLGKTALWAGATDPRFALAIANNSGCGGAALSRREFGETVRRINTVFSHWFCTNFKQYNDCVADLPVDQHELIALIAPRPVYIASAEEDLWADPRGEFLSAQAAGPVYELFGLQGVPAAQMPGLHQPRHGTMGYHIRAGGHDVTPYDWEQYLTFADHHWKL